MGGWVLNWSGRENLCKEGILSWELNSFMAKSIRGRGKSQCAGCVAGISLAGSRNGRIIMVTVLQWWLWVQRVWEALCPLCPCCLTLLWLRQELAGIDWVGLGAWSSFSQSLFEGDFTAPIFQVRKVRIEGPQTWPCLGEGCVPWPDSLEGPFKPPTCQSMESSVKCCFLSSKGRGCQRRTEMTSFPISNFSWLLSLSSISPFKIISPITFSFQISSWPMHHFLFYDYSK